MSIKLDPPGKQHKNASQGLRLDTPRFACICVRHRRGKQGQTPAKCLFYTAAIPTRTLLLRKRQLGESQGTAVPTCWGWTLATHDNLVTIALTSITGKGMLLQLALHLLCQVRKGNLTGTNIKSPDM